MKNKFETSKHAKYSTPNPISQYLVNEFYTDITKCLKEIHFESLLDIGCGEGFLLKSNASLLKNVNCFAIDFDPAEVADAKKNLDFCNVSEGSVYEIYLENEAVELVICTEVMEHLEFPEKALDEIFRVTSKYVLLSVPREPLWRILNMSRGKYLSEWGNTPDHVNHWSSKTFTTFVQRHFEVLKIFNPIPWTIILAKKKIT